MIQPGQYQRASEVLNLPEPFSDDDLHRAADAYEAQFGVPLVRPGEEDAYGRPNAAFNRRVKDFQFKASVGIQGDPSVHRRELDKVMETVKRKGGFARIKGKERDAIVAAIKENRKALGLPPLDIEGEERTAKEIAGSAQKAFAHILKNCATFNDRIAAVRGLDDIQTLELFAEIDKSEQVREAAMDRLQAVRLMEIPEA